MLFPNASLLLLPFLARCTENNPLTASCTEYPALSLPTRVRFYLFATFLFVRVHDTTRFRDPCLHVTRDIFSITACAHSQPHRSCNGTLTSTATRLNAFPLSSVTMQRSEKMSARPVTSRWRDKTHHILMLWNDWLRWRLVSLNLHKYLDLGMSTIANPGTLPSLSRSAHVDLF